MADKTIGSLPQAQTVDDASLFVCEQQGVAMKTTGAQWKGFAIQAVSQYVEPAQQAAQQAQQAAQQATQAVSQIGTAVEDTQANAQAAQEAKEAAETAQGLAETAKTEAEAAASGVAEDAQAAEQAKEAAIAAQQAAEAAEGNAEASATGAATSASQALQSASDASGSATTASGSATTASQAASNAQSAQTLAETAKAGAEAARDAIVNMLVEAITLETGQPATVSKSLVDQVYKLTFGLPKGDTGDTGAPGPQGVSVESIRLTSGNHAPGTTDTYTITLSDDSTFQFTVYNGANGAGAGDFMADGSVPMTGALDMGGNKITNLGAPGADTDAVRKSDLDAVAAEVDGILDGTTPAHLAPATDTKIGGVIIGEGLSVTKDGTLSADDQLPAGGTQGQVLTQGTTGPEWQDAPSGLPDGGAPGQVLTQGESGPEWTDAPDPLPTGGETGQVLTKTASGTAWDDVPSDLPAGGTDGQILTKTDDGVAWENPPDTGVTTFNGRKGEVLPGADDYSASMIKFTDGQTFQQKYDDGQLTGPAGADATINGVNALTIQSRGGIQGSQSGSTYTLDGSDLVQKVDGATAGNVATFAEGGQIQDSGLSPEDFGKQDFVVTFSGNAPGPYSCDKTYAEISAAVESGKNVVGKYNYGAGDAVLPLNSVVTVPNNTFVFVALCVYMGFGRMWFSVDSAGAVQGFVSYQLTPRDIYIAPETDYTAARVRGISLQNTAPSTIPNGFLVGVYE